MARPANSKLAKRKGFLPGKFLAIPPDTTRELITTISNDGAAGDGYTGKTQRGTARGSRPRGLRKPAHDLDAEPAGATPLSSPAAAVRSFSAPPVPVRPRGAGRGEPEGKGAGEI